jgi:hypothetical protein
LLDHDQSIVDGDDQMKFARPLAALLLISVAILADQLSIASSDYSLILAIAFTCSLLAAISVWSVTETIALHWYRIIILIIAILIILDVFLRLFSHLWRS